MINENLRKNLSTIFNSDIGDRKKHKKSKMVIVLTYLYAFYFSALVITSLGLFNQTSLIKDSIEDSIGYTAFEILLLETIVFDLIIRWLIYQTKNKTWYGKLLFFARPGTMISLASLLPLISIVAAYSNFPQIILHNFKILKILRLFRVIGFLSLIPGIYILKNVLKKEQVILSTIFMAGVIVILISATLIYNTETSIEAAEIVGGKDKLKIKSFFDAVYFTTITLTTIGFGDITPITQMGKIIVMVIAISGIAIMAVPTAVISGGFIVLHRQKKEYNIPSEKISSKKQTKKS